MMIRFLINDDVFLEIFIWGLGSYALIRLDVMGYVQDEIFDGVTFLLSLLSIKCFLIVLGNFAFQLLGYGLICHYQVALVYLILYDCCFDHHASIEKVALMVLY